MKLGNALLQKTVTLDFLEKKRTTNTGQAPQYYVEDSHDAIIPRDKFMLVQEEMVRSANLRTAKKKRIYSSKYALSSLCTCEKCGDIYRRIAWKNRGKHSTVWQCCSRIQGGPAACDSPTMKEEDLQVKVMAAINDVWGKKSSVIDELLELAEQSLGSSQDEKLEMLDQRLEAKQKDLVDRAFKKLDYEDLADEVEAIKEEKQQILVGKAMDNGRQLKRDEMISFLNEQQAEVAEYDEQLVRRMVEGITIHEDSSITVVFKSGTVTEIA